MTDAELRDLVAATVRSVQETGRQLQELGLQLEKNSRAADERLDRLSAELKASNERQEQKLNKLAELVGGISNNNGHFAEDMFIACLEKYPVIGNIRFDTVHSHFKGAT